MSNIPIYRKMFETTFLHSGVRGVFSVLTALLTIFVVRLMGPVEHGKFSLILPLGVTSGLFLSWGGSGLLAKYIPEQMTAALKSRFASQAVEVSLLSCLALMGLFLACAVLFPSIIPEEIRSVRYLFVLFVTLVALFNVLQGYSGIGLVCEVVGVGGRNDFAAR